MKEYISYYYHLSVEDLRLVRGKYFFHDHKDRYMFESVYYLPNLLDEVSHLSEVLHTESNFFHQVVQNVQGSIFTVIDYKSYILLRLSNVPEEPISIFDLKSEWSMIIPRTRKLANTHFPWFHLWEKKIDYFENYSTSSVENFVGGGSLLGYFVGLGENAISYLKETLKMVPSLEELPLVPSHRRVSTQMSLIEFYNPINIIFDVRVRDIAEYIKEDFWNSTYDLREIESFLDQAHFSKVEAQLFFARLLFPSFYFDYLEQENLPNHLTSRVEEYQFFLTDIYSYLKDHYYIEEIRWLKKKT